ncbi:MAG: 23S rRNA (guanosine(2251)-2'-O)-methyltransferase RlmB [Candidatus Omnitrophota bacterium]|nr:23S rRNA (guanosine(2251)-2'-O)-methyltransferase RlmB [Candidatus Omnitrophota bacterium]
MMQLYGKNSVFERLKTNYASIRKIIVLDTFRAPHIEKLISAHHISAQRLREREFSRMRTSEHSQGVIAEVDEFTYASVVEYLAKQDKKTVFVFLDRVFDPQNLGAIMRTLACFGGFLLVIPKFKACAITETVLHVAQGAENYVPVSMVTNLSGAIIEAKKAGYWILGASIEEDAQDIARVSIPFPLALVLGSEGEGIRYGVDKHLDIKARIPMAGAPLSLNVTHACAIFAYEIGKQRG